MTTLPHDEAEQHVFQHVLQSLRLAFLDDLPNQITSLENAILALNNPESFRQEFESLYRQLLQIISRATTFDVESISLICQHMADRLHGINGQYVLFHETDIDHLLEYVDLMRQATSMLEQNANPTEVIAYLLRKHEAHLTTKTLRVLIVEHSPMMLNKCKQGLETYSVSVAVLDNGFDALTRLLHEPFDLLISSMEIPKLNGVALIHALRWSRGPNAQIKTLLLTSSTPVPRSTEPVDFTIAKNERFPMLYSEALKRVFTET